jgi:hypothetical protein
MIDASSHRLVPRSVWNSSFASAILAVLLVVELAVIATDAYYTARRLTDPEYLGDRVESAIRENYPKIHEQFLATVKEQAPELAQKASQELVASAPEARQELERLTARQLDLGLNRITALSADEFRQLLDDNRQTIVAAFEQVEQAPEEARDIVLEMEGDIEQQWGIDLQRQARTALAVHRQLNDELERLTQPVQELTPKEQVELRIVRILKALEQQEWQVSQRD